MILDKKKDEENKIVQNKIKRECRISRFYFILFSLWYLYLTVDVGNQDLSVMLYLYEIK